MLKYHIQTIEVGAAGAANITFNNIPQIYTDLLIMLSARTNASGGGGYQTFITLNGSSAGYTWRNLLGTGSITTSQNNGGVTNMGMRISMSSDSTNTANTFGNSTVTIPNYTAAVAKSVSADGVSENNATAAAQIIGAGLWNNTAPVTSVTFYPEATTFTAGSSATLYGIKRGSDGVTGVIPAAEGGTVTTSGGYTIHTFQSSGTFFARRELDVEYLVVAGGGGGSRYGGAGAGGMRVLADQISAGNYPVLVGTGGTGQVLTIGSKGTDSVFLGTTSLGGGTGAFNVTAEAATNGGSGGGAAPSGSGTSGTGTVGQGNNGGAPGYGSGSTYNGAGGGGAGTAGFAANSSNPGNGGAGLPWNGSYYAGGGGGSRYQVGANSIGGIGGGGKGATNLEGNQTTGATPGTPNTGGGGGGTQNGGSGVVIIRYLTPA